MEFFSSEIVRTTPVRWKAIAKTVQPANSLFILVHGFILFSSLFHSNHPFSLLFYIRENEFFKLHRIFINTSQAKGRADNVSKREHKRKRVKIQLDVIQVAVFIIAVAAVIYQKQIA